MYNTIQEIYSVKDTSGIPDPSGNKFLSIELSLDGFSYCILDVDRFEYTVLESFTLEHVRDFEQLGEALENLVKSRNLLTASYQRVNIALISKGVTLVPADLFVHAESKKYLDFNIYPTEDMEIKADRLNNLSAYALYPFPKALSRKLEYLFPGARIRHMSTCLIENVLYMVRYGRFNPNMVLHVQKGHFEILIFKNEQLEFFNSFSYQTWDDLFYYLFFVLEQLGYAAEDLHTMVFGEVGLNSDFYKNIKLYVKSLEFGPRSDLYRYSDAFDEIPHHYFYNLLNLNACG